MDQGIGPQRFHRRHIQCDVQGGRPLKHRGAGAVQVFRPDAQNAILVIPGHTAQSHRRRIDPDRAVALNQHRVGRDGPGEADPAALLADDHL